MKTPRRLSSIGKVARVIAVAAVGFSAGRMTTDRAPSPTSRPTADVVPVVTPAARRASPGAASGAIPAFITPASTDSQVDPAASAEARASRAIFMIERLFRRLDALPPDLGDPELRANTMNEYVAAMTDAVRQIDPTMSAALAGELTRRLCDHSLSEVQTITVAQLGQAMPEAVTARGLECFFSGAAGREDIRVWSMLDTWRQSGQEKTPAITALEKSARDQRTRRRFLPPEVVRQIRRGAATPAL